MVVLSAEFVDVVSDVVVVVWYCCVVCGCVVCGCGVV